MASFDFMVRFAAFVMAIVSGIIGAGYEGPSSKWCLLFSATLFIALIR